MKILVSGAGIAGLTSAFWLTHYGFEVTVIERAPEIRDEGYLVDFYSEGIQIAKAMGILKKLYDLSTGLKTVDIIEADGQYIGGFSIANIQQAMQDSNSGYIPLMRGDLERSIYEALPNHIDFRFDTTIKHIENLETSAKVTFADDKTEIFDLIIGAEGIHSSTRALVFGDEQKFKVPMHAHVAIIRLPNAGKSFNGAVKTNMSVGNFLAAAPTKNGDLIGIFAYNSTDPVPRTHADSLAMLRKIYSKPNPFTADIINQITDDTYIYIDEVSQIRMPKWCQDRVALIGDAASCLTLLSGQGSLMAMTEAYILARELSLANGDHKIAFKAYQDILMPVIAKKAIASAKVSILIPKNWFSYQMFKLVFKFIKFPFIQKKVFGAYMKPTIFDQGYPLEKAN